MEQNRLNGLTESERHTCFTDMKIVRNAKHAWHVESVTKPQTPQNRRGQLQSWKSPCQTLMASSRYAGRATLIAHMAFGVMLSSPGNPLQRQGIGEIPH